MSSLSPFLLPEYVKSPSWCIGCGSFPSSVPVYSGWQTSFHHQLPAGKRAGSSFSHVKLPATLLAITSVTLENLPHWLVFSICHRSPLLFMFWVYFKLAKVDSPLLEVRLRHFPLPLACIPSVSWLLLRAMCTADLQQIIFTHVVVFRLLCFNFFT